MGDDMLIFHANRCQRQKGIVLNLVLFPISSPSYKAIHNKVVQMQYQGT